MRFRSLADWDRLSYNDLVYNSDRCAGSSQRLGEFQGRLRRRCYIVNDTAGVRAALRTQYLGTRISRLSQGKLTLRN